MTVWAIYIRDWHHPERGFEPVYRKDGKPCYYVSPLERFNGRIHCGDTRNALRKAVGELRAMAAIGVFDNLCQLTANQGIELRGWLFNQFGRPILREHLPGALESTEPEVTDSLIGILFEHGWLVHASYKQTSRTGRPRIPNATGSDPVETELGPGDNSVGPNSKAKQAGLEQGQELKSRLTDGEDAAGAEPACDSAAGVAESACFAQENGDGMVKCVRLLKFIGMTEANAEKYAKRADRDPGLVRRAIENGRAKEAARTLRKTMAAYVASFIQHRYDDCKEYRDGMHLRSRVKP